MTAVRADQHSNEVAAGEVRRKLAMRMGFAGLMIVALLGGLALFDYLSAQGNSVESSAPQFNEPVPVAKKVQTQPVTPAEPVLEAAKDEKKTSLPESSALPVDKSMPRQEPPPRPEVQAQPALPRSSPSTARSPVAAPVPPTGARSSEPRSVAGALAPARSEASSPSAPTPPAPPRLFSGYALQAGVFADPRRAEDLQARLMQEGVPATIESRVQVGPFKTKAEAEAAREKLKALGIDTVMLPPRGAKR
jgi:cell division protein FtsN